MQANKEKEQQNVNNGFTLIEVLITMTILAFGILAVASMQIWGIRGNSTAIWHTEAATTAADRIERLMTLAYDHADLATGAHGPVTKDDYTLNWQVTTDAPVNNTKTIVVTVTWTDRGLAKSASFNYYVADL